MTLHEPDVTLTDFALAAECSLFVLLLAGYDAEPRSLNIWFGIFFAATGLAALLGAVTHGFVTNQKSAQYRILWLGIFAAIGIAALACWVIGSRLLLGDDAAQLVLIAASLALVVYMVVVVKFSQSFAVAIIYYLPAAIFLLIAFALAYIQHGKNHDAYGVAGVLLTFVAAFVQMAKIKLHPKYLDHNAFYHVVQAVALFLIFLAAQGSLSLA